MQGKTRKSANRIVFVFSMLAILGIVLSFMQFRADVKEVEFKHLRETLKINTKHKLEDMDHLINEMVNDLEQTAKVVSKYDNFWNPKIKEILQMSNSMSRFEYTAIANLDGNGYDNAGNVFAVAEREYFQTAIKGQVAFSEVMDSKVFPGKRVQIIAHPIRTEDDKVKGIVFGTLNVDSFRNLVSHTSIRGDSNMYIVDSCGNYIGKFQESEVITSGDNYWEDLDRIELEDQTISKIKSDFEERKTGEYSYSYKEHKYYAVYAPIGPNKWQLVYSASDSSANQIVQLLYMLDTKNTIFVAICYLVLTLCIGWSFKQSNNKIRKAHKEATKNIEYMHIAMNYSKNTVFEYSQESRVARMNTHKQNLLFPCTVMRNVPESFISMNVIAPESIHPFERLFERIQTESRCEEDIRIISDEETWYRISLNNIYDEQGVMISTVGIIEDISEQKQRESKIQKKLQVQDALIAKALLYARVDLSTGILVELDGQEMRTPFQIFLHNNIHKKVSEEYISYVEQKMSLDTLTKAYQQGKEDEEIKFMMKCDDGDKWVSCVAYQIDKDKGAEILFVVNDIDTRMRKEIALKEQAERDGLTGLYNAAAIRSKINEILSQKNGLNEKHVFVLFDLDNFKQINDTFGHGYGDQVLIDIATKLNTRFRSSDIIGRLGGDEFIVLLRNIKSYDYAGYLLEELCKSIHKTYRDGEKEVMVSASIGVAMAPSDGNTFEELYAKSDKAQYQIKKNGKNGVKRY